MVSVRRIEAASKEKYGPVRKRLCFVCGGPVTLKISPNEGPSFYCKNEGIYLLDSGTFLLLGDKPSAM